MRAARTVGIALVAIVLLAMSFAAGMGALWMVQRVQARSAGDSGAELDVFWEAWNILDDEFLGETPSHEERERGAARGMVGTFDDPYTVFVDPQPRELERDEMRGHFGGIGAYVSVDDQGRIVLTPMADQAAEQAGIEDGDILIAVDGVDVSDMPSEDVVALIRGPLGSVVTLTVRRPSTSEELDFEIERARVELPTVEFRVLNEDASTGYVAIRLIGERTPEELRDALSDLRQEGVDRLVLDLRHNPGGALSASVEVASEFMSGGVVLYEERQDGQQKPYYARRGGLAVDWPLVVLIDGASASGAEIIAGALQDSGRAQLVGEKSFGKGSVQHVHDLSDGSSLHVTVARWLTPRRQQIDQQGLSPDLVVALTQEDVEAGRDPQLDRAVEQLGAMLG